MRSFGRVTSSPSQPVASEILPAHSRLAMLQALLTDWFQLKIHREQMRRQPIH
jgi:uncharacterized protein (TIGR03435 family)